MPRTMSTFSDIHIPFFVVAQSQEGIIPFPLIFPESNNLENVELANVLNSWSDSDTNTPVSTKDT